MPQHFFRPTNGRTAHWYIRLVPPKHVREAIGAREVRRSTATADRRQAKVIGARLITQQLETWERAVANAKGQALAIQPLSKGLIEYLCSAKRYAWFAGDDAQRFHGDGYSEGDLAFLSRLIAGTEADMRHALAHGQASPEWKRQIQLLEFFAGELSVRFSRTDPLFPLLVREFARTSLEALKSLELRNRGEPVATPSAPANAPKTLSSMSAIYEAYKGQSAGRKHTGTALSIWRRLVEHLGDVALDSVKPGDLYGFLESGMHAATHPWSMDYAHGVVRRTLAEVFDLARSRGLMLAENPADALRVLPRLSASEERQRRHPRYPYTDAQLSAIFKSDWYNPSSTAWRGKLGEDLGARFWVPLVSLCHGCRVGEVLQLLASDLDEVDGVPVVSFREEVEDGENVLTSAGIVRRLKTEATSRVVPLHPVLIERGILKFVSQRRDAQGASALLFPSSLPTPGGRAPKLGRAYEQAYLRFVRDRLGFGRGFGNHSFRHQLEDRIRDAQTPANRWPPGLAQAYTGRKRVRAADRGLMEQEGSEAGYGRGYAPSTVLRYITTLSFEGIELPPPYETWLRRARRR